MVLVFNHLGLILQEWDDLYVVYQPSSSETHVFNETTALILKCLEQGPQQMSVVKEWVETALGLAADELSDHDFDFATARLEELGLIERQDSASTVQ